MDRARFILAFPLSRSAPPTAESIEARAFAALAVFCSIAMSSLLSEASATRVIASVECNSAGMPRFHVREHDGLPSDVWHQLEARERDGGVEAASRVFLESQLEAGDLVIDVAADEPFVALSAATLPCAPHVIARTRTVEAAASLDLSAADANVELETSTDDDMSPLEFAVRAATRVLPGHRVFVHVAAHDVRRWIDVVDAALAPGLVVAWCVAGQTADERTSNEVSSAARALRESGYVAHELVAADDGLLLVPHDPTDGSFIAISADATGGHEEQADRTNKPATRVETVDYDDTPVASAATERAPADAPHGVREVTPLLTTTPGFQFLAPFCRTGYGIAGAYLLRAVAATDAPVAFFPIGGVDRDLLPFAGLGQSLARQDAFDPSLPSVRLSQQFDLALHVGRGPRVGFPIFEVNRFSARAQHHLRSQDHLLVCSDWARGVLLENGIWRSPIDIVPLGVDRSVFHERLPFTNDRDETVFLQVGKIEARKGQRELLAAFEDAFSPRDNVRLVLACHNPFLDAKALDELLRPFRRSRLAAKITLLTAPLASHADVARLMSDADCGVFAARAEGWNLEALEMLSCGRLVIATDYSAHTAYLDDDNARLIEIDGLEPAFGFSDDGGEWAAWGPSQHEQLVSHLRSVHATRRENGRQTNHAGIATAGRFTWDHSATALLHAVMAASA